LSILLFAGIHAIQAMPAQAFPSTQNVLPLFSVPEKPVQEKPFKLFPEAAPMPITLQSPVNGLPFLVYALKSYENFTNIGGGLYVDVYIRFYADNACTIPVYVSGLTINYMILGYNGYNNYQINGSVPASGEYIVLEYQNEYDYADGSVQRYRDYHLLSGDYIPLD
jgi:hypothetical protein